MISGNTTRPRIFPENGLRTEEQINRAQTFTGDFAQPITKLYELGRIEMLGSKKDQSTLTGTLEVNEVGSMSLIRSMANMADPSSSGDESVDLNDISSTKFDIATFLTDDDGTFRGTLWFPKLRVSGFSVNIGDPDAIVSRSFSLVGEDRAVLDEKYLALERHTAVAVGVQIVDLNPEPIEYESGKYIFKVVRTRGGVVSYLLEDASSPYAADTWRLEVASGDYSVVIQSGQIGDEYQIYYMASTAYDTIWTDNDIIPDAVYANQCSIYLKVGSGSSAYIYRLQSVAIDGTFDRADYKEIGNVDIVQSGVNAKTVTVALGQFAEGWTLDKILAGNPAQPYYNARDFVSNISLLVKIYTDSSKTTFLKGYKISNLAVTAKSDGATPQEKNPNDTTLEADNFIESTDEAQIA
jgi:hypothetical protein